MEIELENSRENPLMGREKHSLKLNHEGESTPSKDKIIKKFAAENDLDPEKIEIDSVRTAFGSGFSRTALKVYEEKVRETSEEDEENEEEEDN